MYLYNSLNRLIGLCCVLFYSQVTFGQISDSEASAIQTILLKKEVSEKVFFYYDDEWHGEFHLDSGTFAFISPDTTFQKVYKGILDDFPYTMATDSLIYKKKFYKDSHKAIYVNGIMGFELYIVFKEINVEQDTAKISFFTTSRFDMERFKGNYVGVTGCLVKNKGKWEVASFKIKPIKWTKHL